MKWNVFVNKLKASERAVTVLYRLWFEEGTFNVTVQN